MYPTFSRRPLRSKITSWKTAIEMSIPWQVLQNRMRSPAVLAYTRAQMHIGQLDVPGTSKTRIPSSFAGGTWILPQCSQVKHCWSCFRRMGAPQLGQFILPSIDSAPRFA